MTRYIATHCNSQMGQAARAALLDEQRQINLLYMNSQEPEPIRRKACRMAMIRRVNYRLADVAMEGASAPASTVDAPFLPKP